MCEPVDGCVPLSTGVCVHVGVCMCVPVCCPLQGPLVCIPPALCHRVPECPGPALWSQWPPLSSCCPLTHTQLLGHYPIPPQLCTKRGSRQPGRPGHLGHPVCLSKVTAQGWGWPCRKSGHCPWWVIPTHTQGRGGQTGVGDPPSLTVLCASCPVPPTLASRGYNCAGALLVGRPEACAPGGRCWGPWGSGDCVCGRTPH